MSPPGFPSSTYETLVEKSRALTGLQEPLIHRPDLPPQLATKMCEWVSDALKTYIRTNYHGVAQEAWMPRSAMCAWC